MKLKALSLADLEQVRLWRNEQVEILRTPFPLTAEQQEQFCRDVICNRQANARYWSMLGDNNKALNKDYTGKAIPAVNTELIGMCGLENIQWENRLAEISMVLNPDCPMEQYGEEVLQLLLHEGFMNLNLENVFAEVYACNPNMPFWTDMATKYGCMTAFLPYRKYYKGQYYSSTYINFNKEENIKER